MFDLRTKLLDLDEDLERITWGVQAARAVSAAISLDHAYGEGLYAVSDYLYEVQEKCAETWTCAWRRCAKTSEAIQQSPGKSRGTCYFTSPGTASMRYNSGMVREMAWGTPPDGASCI